MQIPVLKGVYTDGSADFRVSYPVNMEPVALPQGVSSGYLRPVDGIVQFGTGPGIDRGGINWNGKCYRAMGTRLVRIEEDGSYTDLGELGPGGQVSMDYSFDRLAVTSNGSLFYWDGAALVKVLDPDLGPALDVQFVDGFFMTTDGEFLVVTELTDPTTVNPLKYGSSERDPDPVVAVKKIYSEVVAVNRYTVEYFENVGGELFPFRRINGAHISKGAIGTYACCVFENMLAFLGSGRKESPSIYLGSNAHAQPIATREIDTLLEQYTEAQLALAVVEARVLKGRQLLYVHLPDRTIVYDHAASVRTQEPVWFVLTSHLTDWALYRARNFVYCYNKWLCADPTSSKHGYFAAGVSTQYGADVRWEFGTMILYNEGKMAIVHELELVCLTGRVAAGKNPTISTAWSADGQVWGQEHFANVGRQGESVLKVSWLQLGMLGGEGAAMRVQRFRGDSQAHISIARLEARLEALNV
ncbi:MAG: packaged DNA stabilization protein [Gallionella sp.]